MKERIYTIPINDAFDHKDGCPVCRLRRQLEAASLEYVMGPAMMEPDVRIETNRLGFCAGHFAAMRAMKNRLGLALMLESHLGELEKLLQAPQGPIGKMMAAKNIDKAEELSRSCYVCSRMELFMDHYVKNIIFLWKSEPDFAEKFRAQPCFCLPHMSLLARQGSKMLSKKEMERFWQEMTGIQRSYLAGLREDVTAFCRHFDHRFAGEDIGQARSAIERSAAFLSGGTAAEEQ